MGPSLQDFSLPSKTPLNLQGQRKQWSALMRHHIRYSFSTAKNKPGILNTGVLCLNTTQPLARLVLITYYERKFILERGDFSVKNLHHNKSITGTTLCTVKCVMLHKRVMIPCVISNTHHKCWETHYWDFSPRFSWLCKNFSSELLGTKGRARYLYMLLALIWGVWRPAVQILKWVEQEAAVCVCKNQFWGCLFPWNPWFCPSSFTANQLCRSGLPPTCTLLK